MELSTAPQKPIDWLWERLTTMLPTQDYLELQIGFQERQHRCNQAAKLRTARNELARYERMQHVASSQRWTDTLGRKIENRKRRIAELEAELETL